MFKTVPDAGVKKMMNQHFQIITRQIEPTSKHDIPPIAFEQLGFLNLMTFLNAFKEAKRRGILNAGEITVGDEIVAIIQGDTNG